MTSDKEKIKDRKRMVRCGLCNREVDDWKTHEQSEEHQNNLKNPTRIKEAFDDHTMAIAERVTEK